MSAPCPLLGFVVRARPRAPGAETDRIAESLLGLLEVNDLAIGSRRALEFVISRDGSQATQADRELVLDWASQWTDIAEIDVSDLVDLASDAAFRARTEI